MACIKLIMEASPLFHHSLVYAFPLRTALIRRPCQSRRLAANTRKKKSDATSRGKSVLICWNKGFHPHASSSSRLFDCKSSVTEGNVYGGSCARLVFSHTFPTRSVIQGCHNIALQHVRDLRVKRGRPIKCRGGKKDL